MYAYDGDLARFCGAAGSVTKLDASAYALFQRPDVVVNGGDCTNSEAALFILGGVLQHKFILQPGETKEIRMVFGVSESLDEARATAKMYADAKRTESACKETVEYNLDKYSSPVRHYTGQQNQSYYEPVAEEADRLLYCWKKRVCGIICRLQWHF